MHPLTRDGLVALGYLVAGLLLAWVVPEVRVTWWGTASFAATAGTLVVAAVAQVPRRRSPLLALAGVVGAFALSVILGGATGLGLLIVLGDVLYCAVLYTRVRVAWSVAGLSVGVLVVLTGLRLVTDGGREAVLDLLSLTVLLGVPVMWGLEVRRHRDLAEQTRRLAERDRAAAVVAERNRMARDLHDVVAGQVSAIALQSAAALGVDDPAVHRRVLGAVREHSVAALAEMRTMIDLLRSAEPDPRTAPDGLDRLGPLLDSARTRGIVVALRDERTAALPPAVDLAAFRIVQEGLTNAAKHAPGSPVDLRLADGLVVELTNDLPAPVPRATGPLHGGTGLPGLRERAVAVGGSLDAGPDGSRWRLRAELPVGGR